MGALLKPCNHPGCGRLSTTGRCDKHPMKSWVHRKPSKRRYTGRKLQAERERLFAEYPLCVICLREGRETPSTIRDHIIPLEEGGEDVWCNTQAICGECHAEKTKLESARGRAKVPMGE